MAKLLYSVSAVDPATFAVVAFLLALIATVASYIPARRNPAGGSADRVAA
jgi:putative ABC transport system permease protein